MDKKLNSIINTLGKINAKELKIYETKNSTPFFDYVVIATVASNRQLSAFASNIKEEASKENFNIKGIEGKYSSEWVLVDLENILVNVFTLEARNNFDLDKIWKNLPQVDIKE